MQITLEGQTKDQIAISRLREWEPPEGFYVAESGGKDSACIDDLAARAGVKFDAHYSVSPIDPQETRDFLKQFYPHVKWDFYARGFWKQFLSEGPPMRMSRWCCGFIKEAGGTGRVKVMGMRRAESNARKDYQVYQPHCKLEHTDWLLPIVDWTDDDVWQYIRERNLPVNPLYAEGYKRLGCVLCPYESAKLTQRHIERFPKIAHNWRSAMDRYFDKRIERGTPLPYQTKEDFWQWWISRE